LCPPTCEMKYMPTPPGRSSSRSRNSPHCRRCRSNSFRSNGALCPHRASRVFCEQRRIRARCGEGREVNCSAVGRGSGREVGIETGPKGVVFVGALLMNSEMRVLTDFGVTFSIIMKAGRRRTVVGSS
jgi:hypothetical protein